MNERIPGPRKTPETITSFALRLGGDIFTGTSHVHALDDLEKKYPGWRQISRVEDGFMTSSGRFVDREEAERIGSNQ